MSERQQRQGFRLSVSKAVGSVSELKSRSSTTEIRHELTRKALLLTSYLAKLEDYDRMVIDTISESSQLDQEISSIRSFNETVEEAIVDAEILSKPVIDTSQPSPNTSGGLRVKLPTLEISPFSGDPTRWQEFWDAFKSAIHDRSDLSTIDKFTYLRGLLSGEALRLVEGYRVTEANYHSVVEVLSHRYGDKHALVFAHIEALLSLSPSSNDVISLVETHTKLERHLRSLESLQPGQDMILYAVILSKLPRFMKIEAHRKKGSESVWSLAELRKWLDEEIRAREMAERLHRLNVCSRGSNQPSKGYEATQPSFKGGGGPRNSNGPRSGGSASTLVSETKEIRCAFCNGSHYSETCTAYPDSVSRRSQMHDRCLICLGKGHVAKACRRKKPCKYCKKENHHSSLCFNKFGKPQPKYSTTLTASSAESATHRNVDSYVAPNSQQDSPMMVASDKKQMRAVMQTAIAPIESNRGPTAVARLFFDTGASRSFITANKQRELKLDVLRKELLSVSSFQSSQRRTSEHNVVEFGVRCRDGSVQQIVAAVVPRITCPILKIPLSAETLSVPKWSLAEPATEIPEFVNIDVLIGIDYYYSFVSPARVQGDVNLWFLSSRLGYLSAGRVSASDSDTETVAVMHCCSSPSHQPALDLSRYWELEDIGMGESQKNNVEDEEAAAAFMSTVTFRNGRYQVCWPWKTPKQDLKPNYGLALGRLRSLLTRLSHSVGYAQSYDAVFRSQLESGIIEKAPTVPSSNMVYYMPHHAVHKPAQSTTKLRVVFDASSRASKFSSSLNDCLYRGPVLLADLCGLLLRFRMNPVALLSDIEKAFLQVGLQENQRDVTRFLWVNDVTAAPCKDNLVAYRFCRVPFGVVSSPFLLAATISHHLKQQKSQLATKILNHVYVDNVVTGEGSCREAIDHYAAAKKIFSDAAMNLREWYTNSPEVLDTILAVDRGKDTEPKVLGLRWNTNDDTLRVNSTPAVDVNLPVTKRSILKTIPQIFDPCGFFAPVVVVGKLLLQTLWSLDTGWDDAVPASLAQDWHQLVWPNLAAVHTISLPRYIGSTHARPLELHVFCDASARASAAAIYLRCHPRQSPVTTHLLMARSRLAPIRQHLTIPRLELVATVLGARLLQFVRQQLRITLDRSVIWTDSQCVLCWLQQSEGLPRFVINRVKELQAVVDVEFKHVPTAWNPADLPTRGCSLESLKSSQLWWHGPDWLRNVESSWPVSFVSSRHKEGELVVESQPVCNLDCTAARDRLIDDTRHRSLRQLLHTTAYVFRFVYNLKRKLKQTVRCHLLTEEVDKAAKYWIRLIQRDHFASANSKGSSDIHSKKNLSQLNVFTDEDGIVRCRGRIELADTSYDAKYPILLPSSSHFSKLVILSCHHQTLHSGVASTLAKARERFWIVKGRMTVKSVLRECRLCRRFNGGPFRIPPTPPLPAFRLEESPPFTNAGLDYLGPLLLRAVDGSPRKVWICLFTCAVTRAIHLEVVLDLSTDQFLLAFRRFVALYGAPALLVSDNARQFTSAAR